MTGRFWHFDTDVYNLHVGLYLGPLKECTGDVLAKMMKRSWPELADDGHVVLDESDPTVYADCITVTADSGSVYRIVRIPKFRNTPLDHSVLAHETLHLVATALSNCGVPFDEHAEAHAYLMEMVFRRFLEFLYKEGEEKCTAKKDHGSSRRQSAPGTSEEKRSANGAACRRDDVAARMENTRTGR